MTMTKKDKKELKLYIIGVITSLIYSIMTSSFVASLLINIVKVEDVSFFNISMFLIPVMFVLYMTFALVNITLSKK